jgi:hypothetical protein
MRVAALFRPSRWVQWISKENETADRKTAIGCDAIRPPIDFPPAKRNRRALSTSSRTASMTTR